MADLTCIPSIENLDSPANYISAVDGKILLGVRNYHNDEVGQDYIAQVAPQNPPSLALEGDTITENFDNGDVRWTYRSGAWSFDWFNGDAGNFTYVQNVLTAFDVSAFPAAPQVLPPTSNDGDVLIETWLNGIIYWVNVGGVWTLRKADEDNSRTFFTENNLVTFDPSAPPASPSTVAAFFTVGDTVIEEFDNGFAYWTYDGATWTLNWFTSSECCIEFNSESGTTLDTSSNPASPVSVPSISFEGDKIIELFDNCNVYWRYNGVTWVFVDRNCHSYTTYSNQKGVSPDLTNNYQGIPTTVPVGAPTSPTVGDTHEVVYENATARYTRIAGGLNGTWSLTVVTPHFFKEFVGFAGIPVQLSIQPIAGTVLDSATLNYTNPYPFAVRPILEISWGDVIVTKPAGAASLIDYAFYFQLSQGGVPPSQSGSRAGNIRGGAAPQSIQMTNRGKRDTITLLPLASGASQSFFIRYEYFTNNSGATTVFDIEPSDFALYVQPNHQ